MGIKARAERAWARYLIDACQVTRPAEQPHQVSLHPLSGALMPNPALVIYAGRALFSKPGVSADVDRAGEFINATAINVRVPNNIATLLPGDIVTCTASQANPDLVGVEMKVESIDLRTLQATRILRASIADRVR